MSHTLIMEKAHLTDADLAQIVADASFLWERLDSDRYIPTPDQNSQTKIDQRCDRWCQTVAHENQPDILEKRLQWDGLTLDTVRPYLGNVQLSPEHPLPPWTDTLRHIIQTASTEVSDPIFPWPIDPDHPIPFEDIWLPAIHVARQRLLTRLGASQLNPATLPISILSDQAYTALERSLLQRLSGLSSQTLNFEFSKDRSFGQNLLNLLGIDDPEADESNSQYQQFVQELLQDGLLHIFQTYPVLGRLVAVAVDLWVDATTEFIQRLTQDYGDIQQRFLSEQSTATLLGKVDTIQTSLSDPHNQGRTVFLLTFDSGLKLVYKPKDLGMEVAWNQFLTWCNHHSQLLDLKVLQVLNREHYGWVEFVEHLPCADADAVEQFYQRSGMLSCLIYVLRGTDCHHENLIASGEHLVLIDMETLLHHDANLIENSPEMDILDTESAQLFRDSVLRTGLLPRWDFSADQRIANDISGLGYTEQSQSTYKLPRWYAINTDNMHLRSETVTLPINKNVPHLEDMPLSSNNYQDQIVDGFKQMYHFLMGQKSQLLATEGPLVNLQHQRVRFILRATRIYFILLRQACTPDYLKYGVDFSIELDHLSRAFVLANDKPDAWPLLQSERQAMEQLDIPFFTANISDTVFPLNDGRTITNYFKQSSYQAVVAQIQTLNEANLAQQVAIIQGAFYAKVAHPTTIPGGHDTQSEATSNGPILSRQQLIQAARDIAIDLEARALQDANGSLNWIGMGFVAQAERFQQQMLNDSLYDGRCGVSLFFAALYQVTQDSHYQDLALRVIQPLTDRLQVMDTLSLQRYIRLMGLGGAGGVGSLIYSVIKISRFLNDETLLANAQTLATAITPELIAADQTLDIIGGAAGCILGLLPLYQVTDDATVLQQAAACGDHLLSYQTDSIAGPRAWKTIFEKPLTGFSHGATGIAYALLRLYGVTNDLRYREAALEGMAYERSLFSQAQANWPDLRDFFSDNQPTFPVQWCHGAAGIGLGRIGAMKFVSSVELEKDLKIALHTTQQQGVKGTDHLCCGNLGLAEVLLAGAQHYNNNNNIELTEHPWRQTALQTATAVVARAQQAGAYQLFANLPKSVFNPGFFQGTAGIGYQLLRLAHEQIPSVLLWE
ncbi:type 2 lanthipeptide synthetase LanM family protein [Leptothoe spongobia]|uniref:Type 2 lantipeptide synthetase LanM family protein n=1 Tax=Leptothoe spongobia TAU-MAC 1115 TaxID=1967444 RepID=A0A947DF67_9CYAN|nr:type 2 lanthipeptide synthetase LanM family protein [Leptothoe spongobia]MBT9315785.1 type 2 lantipeptide synthetase LanM family protein [Leptothoe spongobia TAU-MAC 1115]